MWPKLQTTVFLFIGICAFRVANTFLIQSFFDPDEYWQTLEPAYCEVFLQNRASHQEHGRSSLNLECAGYTWEWKRRATSYDPSLPFPFIWVQQWMEGPIRSYLSVLPTHLFYALLAKYHWDTHFLVSQGPKILTAVIAAAPTDLAVWMLAHWLPGQDIISLHNRQQSTKISRSNTQQNVDSTLPWFCLFCSMFSWFHGYALVRTFSNSLETMLLTVSMTLVAPELLANVKTRSGSRVVRQSLCFLLGGCSVAMRFSSVTAWIPMGILLANQCFSAKESWISWLVFLIRVCAVFGALGVFLACAVDRYFYGFWTVPFLGSFHFNVVLGNSLLYGSHSWHWYFTAGMPAVTGLLFPLLLWDLWLTLSRKDGRSDARRNLWIIMLTYTVAHSQSGHKEFRFLMPLLPLLCLVAGPHLQSLLIKLSGGNYRNIGQPSSVKLSSLAPWLFLFAIPNLIALLYLGLFHQSAPISINHRIASIALKEGLQINAANGSTEPHRYAVHYLTGSCHSTPLHSYLHVQGSSMTQFDTWSLDCSPDCRSDQDALCESEQFARDPVGFFDAAYTQNPNCVSDSENYDEEQSCSATDQSDGRRQPPHFLVTYADYSVGLRDQLTPLGFEEVGRFFHGINGLKIGNTITTGDGYSGALAEEAYRRISVMKDFLEFSVDEMVLYQQH